LAAPLLQWPKHPNEHRLLKISHLFLAYLDEPWGLLPTHGKTGSGILFWPEGLFRFIKF
jgi:hypothetical protein